MTLGPRTVDRWLASRFLRAYLTFVGSALLVFLVVDVFTNLESLARRGLPMSLVHRYGSMLPEVYLTLSPFLTLLAAVWVVGALKRQNELVPLYAAGYSPPRVAFPMLACAAALAVVSWADRDLLLPRLAELRRADSSLRQDRLSPRPVADGDEGVLAARFYYPGREELEGVTYTHLDARGGEASTVLAARARPAPDQGGWVLESGYVCRRRATDGGHDQGDGDGADGLADDVAAIASGGVVVPSRIALRDVEASIDAPTYLSARQIRDQLRRTPGFRHLEVQLYERYTFPLAGLVLLLVGIPVVLGGPAAGGAAAGVDTWLRLAVCVALCMGYFFVSTVSYELGSRDVLAPAPAALLPLVSFGGAGVVLTIRMR